MTNKVYYVTVATTGVAPATHNIIIVPTAEVGGSVFELSAKYAEFIKETYDAVTAEVVAIRPMHKAS